MKKLMMLGALFSMTPTASMADEQMSQFYTGNSLLEQCTGDTDQQMLCIGYLQGVSDSVSALGVSDDISKKVRVPVRATGGQLRDIVIGFLNKHPEMRHNASAMIVYLAYWEAFKE